MTLLLLRELSEENAMAQENEPVRINGQIEGFVHFEIVPLEDSTGETVLAALNDLRAKWEPENSVISLLGSDKPIAKITHQWPSQIRGHWHTP